MKQMLGDFIYELRKEKGYSQAELGDLVGVSNKAVSKWETGEANPDLNVVTRLAEVLNVTADELLNCRREEKTENAPQNNGAREGSQLFPFFKSSNYEYISKKRTKKGVPYVHINLFGKAHGVFALGLSAKGIVAIGLFARGIIAFGLVALGLLAFGSFALGILAAGAVAIGGVAAGGVAIGGIAVGGVAIGGLAVGALAIGYWAHTGVDGLAIGIHEFIHINNLSKK